MYYNGEIEMRVLSAKNISIAIDEVRGVISSFALGQGHVCIGESPIFVIRLRDRMGGCHYVRSSDASNVLLDDNDIVFDGFGDTLGSICARVSVEADESIEWKISISGMPSEYVIEWVEFPKIRLPRLVDNEKAGGRILFPYNEGMIVTDETLLPRYEIEWPSSGSYFTFPNMVCSQFMAYLFDDIGLYIGAHDSKRGLKCVDFYSNEGGISLQMRLFSGVDFGEDFSPDFPVIWQSCGSNWRDAADIYRAWLDCNLPPRLVKIADNPALPEWYKESPLIVTYPVRGVHDMDKMDPNALFPYTNALPILNKIKADTGTRLLALLMHWEGTAPWAPPYVWPPFGGVDAFNEFRDALHKNGDLLGVYCSGFGYTLRSTLIEEYDCEEKIKKGNVLEGVCHSPENKPELGITCTPYQRYGYDICPASVRGREILDEAFSPLFKSGIDYAQILDQNHGGGQYMCYARGHGHPPVPGTWMTENMIQLLSDWKKRAPNMLFGCESAAAEPFISGLLMSDNRFELNYPFGEVIPLYAYIYHEYVRNFMGNQCGCPFEPSFDTLRYRLAYSFSIGDFMTLILAPNGNLMSHWGTHDFEHAPDMDKTMRFIKNMKRFYDTGAGKYLLLGRMANAPEIECEKIIVPLFRGKKEALLPALLCSCWQAENGKIAYIVVNPENTRQEFSICGEQFEVAPLDATLILK